MKVTVIICTCNRSASLAKTLTSLAASKLPPVVEWEVLVVDNNSTDQTRAITEEFCFRFPGRFRYLIEPRPGKSFALNSGIRAARGDVLAFTDDDVIVEPAWLRNLTLPLKDRYWAGTGGRTLPTEPVSPPPWLPLEGPDSMAPVLFAHFDLGDKPGKLVWPPFGANMAFRKAMFEKYGDFRTDLGPSPNKSIPRPSEDCEFGRRLFAAEERLYYVPSAIVRHPIQRDRVRKGYFLDWSYDYGRAFARELRHGPSYLGIRPHSLAAAVRIGVETVLWISCLDPQRRFIRKTKLWRTVGHVLELYRLPRNKNINDARQDDREKNDESYAHG
jgi:glucosyl-dolichyl phosphate glucuronosyltransferase